MERYFMIINNETGENQGFYITGIWEYDNIITQVKEGETLKEISKELWSILIGNNKEIKLNSPTLKKEKIEEFLTTNFNARNNIKVIFYDFFEEKVFEPVVFEPTQLEKDIKFLAETLKEVLMPMMLPSETQTNTTLIQLQKIINRYER